MNILKTVLENAGYISESELEELAVDFPNLAVGIKFSCSPRVRTTVGQVRGIVDARMADGVDYVREVYIPVPEYDNLCGLLGVSTCPALA